jgi:putative DNA primase/helicase
MNDEAARQGRPDTYNVSALNDTTGRGGANVATIPAELRSRPQWVVWRLEQRDGKPKPTKVPYRADGLGRASSTDSTSWSTFDMAVAASATADGIGYVFSADDPYVGVDLDDGLSEADRAAVMLALDSYTETSFSGDGAHVIIRASLDGGRHPHGFGVFDQRRFFVVTGMHVRGTPETIEPRQDERDQVLARYLPAAVTSSPIGEPRPVDFGDQEILDLAANAANGADFEQLWQGNLNGHPSQSEADLDLCGRLAFWTGADPARIDRIFRASGLMRAKWDTRRGDATYGSQTITKALEGCSDTYSGVRVPPGTQSGRDNDSCGGDEETAIASPRPDVVGTRDGTQSLSPALVSSELSFVSAEAFVGVDEPGAAALVGDDDNVLVPEGGDVMFYGDGGAGKTTLMIDLACHLAAGDDWLGIGIKRPVRVAIIENEGPRPLFRAKLRRKLRSWAGSPLGGRLLQLNEPWSKVSLDDPAVRVKLAAKVAELELDAILLGPVTASGMNEAGTLQQVRDYVDLIGEVRIESRRRVTFLLAHHENRGGQPSGAWEGAVDTLFHVQAQGNGRTRLFVQKARWSPEHHKQKMQLAWAAGEGFEVLEDEDRDDNQVADEILAYVRANGGGGWNKVDKAVAGKSDRLRTIRDSLLEGGRLVNRGTEARMKLWHADDPALPVDGGSLGDFYERTLEAQRRDGHFNHTISEVLGGEDA